MIHVKRCVLLSAFLNSRLPVAQLSIRRFPNIQDKEVTIVLIIAKVPRIREGDGQSISSETGAMVVPQGSKVDVFIVKGSTNTGVRLLG